MNRGFTRHHFLQKKEKGLPSTTFFDIKKSGAGFSIIELLVVVVIFSIVIGATVGVFVSAVKIQKYNLSHQHLLNQVSYAMEYMERAIRMAVTDDGTCGFSGNNYRVSTTPAGVDTKIEFMNYEGDCQEFYLDINTGQLKASKTGSYSDIPLTSDDFTVTFLRFNTIGEIGPPGDFAQPRVTVVIKIEGRILGPDPKMRIQTTVSQRNLDI